MADNKRYFQCIWCDSKFSEDSANAYTVDIGFGSAGYATYACPYCGKPEIYEITEEEYEDDWGVQR